MWMRQVLTVVAAAWTSGVFLIVAGALLPRLPLLGTVGTLCETSLSLHITLAGIVGLLLAVAAWWLGGARVATVTGAFAMVATLGSLVPLVAFVRVANRYGAPISWMDHLRVTARGAPPAPSRTLPYATIDGKTLHVDIYLPREPAGAALAAVLMMHSGGYIAGDRSMDRNWNGWFADRGYTVFDVDYRLAPPPTWNQAAQDVACAMVWMQQHAESYHIALDRMLIAGPSAGGGLALQVAYGLGDGTVRSSCGGSPPQPAAVFALYPPDDFALGWDSDMRIPFNPRSLLEAYIGGSPQQYPERYRAVSATFHVRPGLPPTFIAAGDHDHLVPFEGHPEIARKLTQAGVPNVLVTIPYSDHAFDLAWGSLGAQITRHTLATFLDHYLPATQPH
jgi:acetyl esterase